MSKKKLIKNPLKRGTDLDFLESQLNNTSFADARKLAVEQGLDVFQWNGNWYSTEDLENSYAPSSRVLFEKRKKNEKVTKGKSSVENGRAKHSVQRGNRYKIVKLNNGQYAIHDSESYGYLGNSFNSLEEAQSFLNSNDFANMYEVAVVAPRIKVDRKTPGYSPVDSRVDLVNENGQTRVFRNDKSGEYFVTDNYGNIVAQNYDPAVANPGFMGWNVYTGSEADMVRSDLGAKQAEYNMNEVNQLAEQAEQRQTEQLVQDMTRGKENFVKGTSNIIMGGLNTPTHAVTGLLRTAHPEYTVEDYLKGFYALENPQTTGLGTVVSDYMEEGPLKNTVQLVGDIFTPTFLKMHKAVKGQGFYTHMPTHTADAHDVVLVGDRAVNLGHATLRNSKGNIVGNFSTNLFRNIPINQPVDLQTVAPKLNQQMRLVGTGTKDVARNYSILNPYTRQVTTIGSGATAVSPYKLRWAYDAPKTKLVAPRTTYRPSVQSSYIEGITSYTKPEAIFTYRDFVDYSTSQQQQDNTSVPTAVFKYDMGPVNQTVMGRILTGDFVPGTTSPYWDGTINGGQSYVYNTNGIYFPGFGGITVGPAINNTTDKYTNDSTPSKKE